MNIIIKVDSKSDFDPFDPNYLKDDKQERQHSQTDVENSYNVKIKYVNYTDSESFGLNRINAITQGHVNGDRIGDIYMIDTSWIPTLVKSQALASLYNFETLEGFFDDFRVQPEKMNLDIATYKKNVYAYLDVAPRPDYFMYFNADLVKAAGLKDPAQMWLDGEWTWSNFKAYLDAAKALPDFADAKLLSGQAVEFALGFVSAQGGCFVHQMTNYLMLTNEPTVRIIDELKTMFDNGYIDNDISDVSSDFISGSSLFATGELWFLKNETRFSSSLPFEIGAVPYPVVDGDAQTLSTFRIPVYGNRNAFAIANVEDGENGLNSKTLFEILYYLEQGIMHMEMIPEDDYRLWLESKFKSQLYVDAIMSVQDPKYQYFEKIFMASVTAGGGSHYGPNGMYPLLNGIITNPTGNTRMELEDVQTVYETILADFK